jgi:isobutyryl-CoA mutase
MMSIALPTADPQREAENDRPPLRFVTAASLFDGHDAAINVMRRLIQDRGAEVIHLGHNRSVVDIVRAAIQEDADAIAISSYQGGHTEFFKYAVEMLRERGAGHILVFGGGGGTITEQEIAELEGFGVTRLYHPNDGMKLGLTGMIDDLVERARDQRVPVADDAKSWTFALKNEPKVPELPFDDLAIAQMLSALEDGVLDDDSLERLRGEWATATKRAPVVGITGTGGAGKSTVTDELLSRFAQHFPEVRVAVVAVDPTRRRTGGALLGDRIRMNSLRNERIFMRSVATRQSNRSTSAMLSDAVAFLRSSGFDLVLVETAGIGQSDSEIVDLVDVPVYVMTSEFGAASQLEKIDMLDLAEVVVINKFDKRGAEDALRDVRKQWKRNHVAFERSDEDIPVYPTVASQFDDPGLTWMFANLCRAIGRCPGADPGAWDTQLTAPEPEQSGGALIPDSRVRYLAEIAEQGRGINTAIEHKAKLAAQAQHYLEAARALGDGAAVEELGRRAEEALAELGPEARVLLDEWDARVEAITAETYSYTVRDREVTGENYRRSLSQQSIPKIAPPHLDGWGDRLRFLMKENLPGSYPYTGGVFPYRRQGEDPTRMFAGEGTPERTNRRFHYLSAGQPAARLSTAFDSVTLYGSDPHERPDIYGKVGNSGV